MNNSVPYGCETWFLTLREMYRLRVFQNKVLRKIFVVKRDEITGEWRKFYNSELHALYFSPNIIRGLKLKRVRFVGHVAHMEQARNVYSGKTWENMAFREAGTQIGG